MRLIWDLDAMTDRTGIFDYIEQDDPAAAIRVDDDIIESSRVLLQFPQIGREGREPETRELMVDRTPYLLIYEVSGDVIRVLRVLHGAQEWP